MAAPPLRPPSQRRSRVTARGLRDAGMYLGGMAGILHQTLIGPVEPELLVIFGGMIGLPQFLRRDEGKGGGGE